MYSKSSLQHRRECFQCRSELILDNARLNRHWIDSGVRQGQMCHHGHWSGCWSLCHLRRLGHPVRLKNVLVICGKGVMIGLDEALIAYKTTMLMTCVQYGWSLWWYKIKVKFAKKDIFVFYEDLWTKKRCRVNRTSVKYCWKLMSGHPVR